MNTGIFVLDLLNTVTAYVFIAIIALYFLWNIRWAELIKLLIPILIIALIVLSIGLQQYFITLIIVALTIIFWKKIPKPFFFGGD